MLPINTIAWIIIVTSCCIPGAPVIMSLPHFLYAAPQYINAIEGMKPDPEKHNTQLDVEPVS